MKTYLDPLTGYEIRQYTFGPDRCAKLYFSTENFSADDKYFFFTKSHQTKANKEVQDGLFKGNVETGEEQLLLSPEFSGFAMHWTENYAIAYENKRNMVVRVDIESGKMQDLGTFPQGCSLCGHLTEASDGRIACTVQLENKVYAICYLDPGQKEARVAYMTDQWLGHSQICPTDSNQIFFVHETGGDALQRTWMFDVKARRCRPYYVEHEHEWVTHETWTWDGSHMIFMGGPNDILLGDRDGRCFKNVYHTTQDHIYHPGISRDMKWAATDCRAVNEKGEVYWKFSLVNLQTGKSVPLAVTRDCLTGSDHLHPSFNRAGDKILFSCPGENNLAQVCMIDLNQVQRP